MRAAYKRNAKKYRLARWFSYLKKRFRLPEKLVRATLKKQKHRCAICEVRQFCGGRKRLYADHDHETKKFRGFICFKCNVLLGMARDQIRILKAAIGYLRRS